MRSHWLLFFTLIHTLSYGQQSAGAAHYFYTHQTAGGSIVPTVWLQNKKGWYGALRYNYEDVQTATAMVGKTSTWGKRNTCSIMPMAGVLYGNSNGFTLAVKGEVEVGKIYFSTEPQYVFSFSGEKDNFYFNWSEVAIDLSNNFFTGLAVQHTLLYGRQPDLDKGIFAGFSIKDLEVPFYIFKRRDGHYFVMGISWKWSND